MIQQILLWYSIASVVFIAFLFVMSRYFEIDFYDLEKRVGSWGIVVLTVLFFPIMAMVQFYYWNFIDVKSNQVNDKK